jgi:hypothetical protein
MHRLRRLRRDGSDAEAVRAGVSEAAVMVQRKHLCYDLPHAVARTVGGAKPWPV